MRLSVPTAATFALSTSLVNSQWLNPADESSTWFLSPRVFKSNGTSYFASEHVLVESCAKTASWSAFQGNVISPVALTSFHTDKTVINGDLLSTLTDQYKKDDVWTLGFLGAVAIHAPKGSFLTGDGQLWLLDHGVQFIASSQPLHSPQSSEIPIITLEEGTALNPGPYYASITNGCLKVREVYRLYPDILSAFTQGIVPDPHSDSFSGTNLYDHGAQYPLIPIPSRLYSLLDTRPLAGLRLAVKDIYHIKGIKTSGGSRVYFQMYPEANETAISVQKLLDLGAVAIGKTKTSQFAFGVITTHWQDYKYPWSPRGDGYLQVARSSSGSGAAIVGYDWLDVAVGSDTTGSVRMPASLGGSYGMRPTHDAISLEGVLPLCRPLDTAGIFTRDPALFSQISRLWYADDSAKVKKNYQSLPKRILYPIDYPQASQESQEVWDRFIQTLSDELDMTIEKVNITETLHASGKPHIYNRTVTEALISGMVTFDSWRGVGKDLVSRWNNAHPDAGFPPLDAETRNGYAKRDQISQADYDEFLRQKADFQAFWEENLVRPREETCSESIMIMDGGTKGLPSYRVEDLNVLPDASSLYIEVPGPQQVPVRLAPLASAPEISLPIGQSSYQSVISMQKEPLPVVIDLMVAPGCDRVLLDLVEILHEKGILQSVKTGRAAL